MPKFRIFGIYNIFKFYMYSTANSKSNLVGNVVNQKFQHGTYTIVSRTNSPIITWALNIYYL